MTLNDSKHAWNRKSRTSSGLPVCSTFAEAHLARAQWGNGVGHTTTLRCGEPERQVPGLADASFFHSRVGDAMRLGGAMRLGERHPFLERAHPHTSATSANTRCALPHAVHTPTEGAGSDSIDGRSGSLAGTLSAAACSCRRRGAPFNQCS